MKIETKYLRPKKAALLDERYRLYDEPAEPRITGVDNGCVIPAYTDCHGDVISGVTDAEGRFISDSHMVDYPDEVESYVRGMDFTYHDETVVYVGMFNPHWGHFITDCLATFWFLGSVDADRYVFSYREGETPHIHANIRMALTLLGVWDKIEFVSAPRRYRHIYVPRKGMVPRGHVLGESAAVYDTIIARALAGYKQPAVRHDKIIMSRCGFAKALLNDLGTCEVERVFEDNGYYPVYPEQMTLTELIGCLSAAREVVAISGTLAHNMLFAPEGSRLTVLEKYANINNYQQGIDRLRHLEATYIDVAYFIWPIDPGLGPFIMADTSEFRRFAQDHGLRYTMPPADAKRLLRRFFRLYYRHYKRRWIMPEWLEPEISLFSEAYEASQPLFGPWLDGSRPLFPSDALRPRFIAKTLLRQLRRR